MIRFLLDSYILLVLASVACARLPRVILVLVITWLVVVAWYLHTARSRQMRLRDIAWSAWVSQSPGTAAAVLTLLDLAGGSDSEWGAGFLQVWTHPFQPLMEDLPAKSMWHLSDAFLAACAIPTVVSCLITLVGAGVWQIRPDRLADEKDRHKKVFDKYT